MGWSVSGTMGFAVFALALILMVSCADADVSASTSKLWHRLQAGQDALFSIEDDIPFTEIKFTLKNMTENVDIELNVLSDNDTLIETPAPEEVYKYIRIIPTNIQAGNLERATIRFRVTSTWISNNNIKNESIALYRYETSWSGLNTTLIREDENHAYYEALADKFSLYAISGEKGEAEQLCSPGLTKCIANDLYQCSSDGMAWETLENCAYGCDAGACRAETCLEVKVCNAGEQKCSGNGLQQCKINGTGWETVRDCPGGCILCAEEEPKTNAEPLYMALIISQVMIGILVVILIALSIYWRRHK